MRTWPRTGERLYVPGFGTCTALESNDPSLVRLCTEHGVTFRLGERALSDLLLSERYPGNSGGSFSSS